MIRLFEISNDVVIPTEHCHTIKFLKAIIDEFPEEQHVNIFAYIFYMSCPSEENPFFNVQEVLRDEIIAESIEINFDTEHDLVLEALERTAQLYETPSVRAYKGISTMLDNLSVYLATTQITDGRDGNLTQLKGVAKDFQSIRESFKGVAKDLEAEQKAQVRGGQELGYDQRM